MSPARSFVTQSITFDDSGLAASLNFIHNRSDRNLESLVSTLGNRLAYAHYLWVNPDAKATVEEFWSQQLCRFSWSKDFEEKVIDIKEYLVRQERRKWMEEVLRYLPERHSFNTTVYLNLGYDNIVFGENVALNMSFQQFFMDKRESTYYLIHELAHAGYVKYHALPTLSNIKTNGELLKVIKYLTHLEGMGVQSALKLRISEGGMLDKDYQILFDCKERGMRISRYFRIFDKLRNDVNSKVAMPPIQVFGKMSGKESRLWYITGCHMAQEIERLHGIETLRKLVKKGSEEFFNEYLDDAYVTRTAKEQI